MIDYNQSSYYEKWDSEDKYFTFCLILSANIIHVLLMTIGFRKVKALLELFVKPSKREYTIPVNKSLEVRTPIKRKFKALRSSSYTRCNCLSSSLLLWLILRREGLNSQLCIGARKRVSRRFKAHAWIEIDNIPINTGLRIREKYQTFNYDFSHMNYKMV